MNVNRRLHLVIPIEQDTITLYAHSTAISVETFDAYFLPIAKAFSAIYSEGLGVVSGPRVAARLLKQIAQEAGIWDGKTGVNEGLVAEIKRLTNIFAPSDGGWQMVPFEEAQKTGLIDDEDAGEVENAIVFFTLIWHMQRKTARESVLAGACALWSARLESLNATEFADFLRTSKQDANSGEKKDSSPQS